MDYVHKFNHVEELVKFAARSSSVKDPCRTRASHVCDAGYIASSLIHQALFLENSSLLSDISRDSWAVYSHIRNVSHIDQSGKPASIDECLVKMIKTQPTKSYLRLSFRQFINFILNKSDSALLVDVDYLMSFVNELRASYDTLCLEDRRLVGQIWKAPDCDRIGSDALFLSNWSTIEAAKYCVCHKFAPDMSANEFLNLLQSEILLPVSLANKVFKRFLVNFLHTLDKYILDRVADSSTGKHTFNTSSVIEKFYEANCSKFKLWLLKNRPSIARLALTVDDPAECLRNLSLILCLDSRSPCKSLSINSSLISPVNRLNPSNLSLITISAKQLHDLPLLYGLQALVSSGEKVCDIPIVDAVISNLEGHYQTTYDNLLDRPIEMEEQNLIEFLNSCIELGKLEENIHHVDELKSSRKRDLYKNYSRSRSHGGLTSLRLEELEQWLSSWTDINDLEQKTDSETLSIKSCLDLIVPTCLNIISHEPKDTRLPLVERIEWLISQDFIAQCLFTPNILNRNIKIFHVLIELLKEEAALSENLIQTHAKDLQWNHTLYRHLCDLRLIERLRSLSSTVELVQYRAAKFNSKHNNLTLANEIANDLIQKASSCEIRLLSSLLMTSNVKSEDKYGVLLDLAKQIENSDVQDCIKNDLISKVVRRLVRVDNDLEINGNSNRICMSSNDNKDSLIQAVSNIDLPDGWRARIDSSNFISKTRTYLLFSKLLNSQSGSEPDNDRLLNMAFNLDLDLLESLSESIDQKHRPHTLECGTRVLSRIANHHKRLSTENFQRFSSDHFIIKTLRIWIVLKNNLISLIFCEDSLTSVWTEALTNVLKIIGKSNPNLLIYSIIMNRLDLKKDISRLVDNCESSKDQAEELCAIVGKYYTCKLNCNNQASRDRKLEDCRNKLAIWNELLDYIKSASCQAQTEWHNIITDTELFLKELRKISFLCGEYLRILTASIPRRLNACLKYYSKFCDPQAGKPLDKKRLDTFEKRLVTECDHCIESVKNLLSYRDRVGDANLTLYDVWFYQSFTKQLNELQYRLALLTKRKGGDLARLVKSITELLKMCRSTLMEYNRNNRQQVYMEMISPVLSRLSSSHIPMPDCCDKQLSNSTKPIVTINKVSQTVHLIHSKTYPKKLKFLGSDGIARSFLLKAHEDLRLDQFIMELFGSLNELLVSKESPNMNRIRRYSVTPISSQSGLIQWVEAPSLCSSYRAWLNSPNGKKMINELYSGTCEALCADSERIMPRSSHLNCQPPQDCQMFDLFYQLLWAKTKPVKHSISENKPCVGNCREYRALFDSSVFQCVVEQLTERTPKELFSNQLWYKSNNAHSYWLKTQRFINSCATMSIVGYIIGLGDRHLENILLDCNSGEIIHIDYNICFELGKTLSIPERVPFRLTPNIIHSFGYAGLKGRFTITCRDIMNVLRERKSTLLHLIDRVNLSFLQIKGSKVALDDNCSKPSSNLKANVGLVPQPQFIVSNQGTRLPDELEMCSQESIEIERPVDDVAELLIMNHHSLPKNVETGVFAKIEPKPFSSASSPFDSQHNIKNTADLPVKVAPNIQERIKDKLNGTDECMLQYKDNKQFCNVEQFSDATKDKDRLSKQDHQAVDLILLNDAQSVEEQVDALIKEAISIRNRAKMFEGWLPWV